MCEKVRENDMLLPLFSPVFSPPLSSPLFSPLLSSPLSSPLLSPLLPSPLLSPLLPSPPLSPLSHLSVLSLPSARPPPFTGEWFTEYAYIDTEGGSQQQCVQRNNTDGYRRVWARRDVGEAAECLVLPNAPTCIQGGWTRVNHLGNGRDGVPLNFTWTIPYFPSGRSKLAVLRVRYVRMRVHAFMHV